MGDLKGDILVKNTSTQIETIVREALPEGMCMEDVKDRCKWVYQPTREGSTLYLDNKPILTLYPPEFETKEDERGIRFIMSRKVKYYKHE